MAATKFVNRKVTRQEAKSAVGYVSGVKSSDTVFEAAEKAIKTMRIAGMSPRAIAKAEKMLADARERAR